MISEDEARARILANLQPLPLRRLPLIDALNCFCGRDLFARISLPSFDNSSMDGFAVISADAKPGARLKLIGEQPAGIDRQLQIRPGEAIRIFTGAPIPAGADAVVMQEDTALEGNALTLMAEVAPGENIRRRGGDVAEGQKIISAGEQLRAQQLALLAAQGFGEVEVGGQVRVAIISTGDELVAPGGDLQAGQIYDSNSVLLRALVRTTGATIHSVTHCGDREEETEAALRAGHAADIMIISGGVSVGARDFVKSSLTAVGATLDLWRVSVKPGKPFLFGRSGHCPIFGLPGNPISVFVTFLLFVRVAILRMSGANTTALELRRQSARLNAAISNPGERPHYIRGVLGNGEFIPVGRQESHALFGLSRSNALLRLPAGAEAAAGGEVTVLLWD
ncbi:MAG TPA: gephyrin-like molybdotransferase Glp [Chthoniobacterales bacterium]|nr:gephyrin-like molybdotransferase Glp [Chthoniobacterales bacterium]